MNEQARESIHKTKEALRTAKHGLQAAAEEAENGHIINQINEQLTQVTSCLDQCERIASGLSQYLNEKTYEGIHH